MKEERFYNVIFPVWLILLYPLNLIFVLPINFIIDYLVLRLGAKHLQIDNYKEIAKRSIIKTWLFGFLSDIIGGVMMFVFNGFAEFGLIDFVNAVMYDPFSRIDAFLAVVLCIFIAALCIYFFNLKFVFKKFDLDLAKKRRLALYLAIITAPYLFLLPTMWFVY